MSVLSASEQGFGVPGFGEDRMEALITSGHSLGLPRREQVGRKMEKWPSTSAHSYLATTSLSNSLSNSSGNYLAVGLQINPISANNIAKQRINPAVPSTDQLVLASQNSIEFSMHLLTMYTIPQ
jgi:hypothetical protein